MARIGLIDCDGHNYPNLPLMKLSAWHKQQGDTVEWYEPFNGLIKPYTTVYLSKVFSFTQDYEMPIYAQNVIRGGVQAIVSKRWMEKRFSTKKEIIICRTR